MPSAVDWTLYLVLETAPWGKDPLTVAEAALRGGVTVLQLREKARPVSERYRIGLRLRELTRRYGVPLIVNDRVDLARALEADGVHVGPEDLPPALVRRLLGPEGILGVSGDTLEEVAAAEAAGATYLGVGTVYPTRTKADAGEAIGPEGIARIVAATSLPVVAIGGITAENLAPVVAAGAAGVAVVSAICAADDPEAAARRLREAIETARRGR